MAHSKQLAAEIAASLRRGTPHSEATPADWKRLVADIKKRFHASRSPQEKDLLQEEYKAAQLGLQKAQQVAAHAPTFVTGTNLFALTKLVIQHGPQIPSRLDAVDAPHIKRTLAAGLLESAGNKLRLTAAGRAAVGDELVQMITRERGHTPRENTFVPPDKRAAILARDVAAHEAKIQQLEDALTKLA